MALVLDALSLIFSECITLRQCCELQQILRECHARGVGVAADKKTATELRNHGLPNDYEYYEHIESLRFGVHCFDSVRNEKLETILTDLRASLMPQKDVD